MLLLLGFVGGGVISLDSALHFELGGETRLFFEPAVQLHSGSIATDSKWRPIMR